MTADANAPVSPPGSGAGKEPEATSSPVLTGPPERRLDHTRLSATYRSLIAGTLVLVLLLVFILENTQPVKVTYLGASGHLALGVALLLAAVGGALIVGIVGSARIFQVRRRARGHRA